MVLPCFDTNATLQPMRLYLVSMYGIAAGVADLYGDEEFMKMDGR